MSSIGSVLTGSTLTGGGKVWGSTLNNSGFMGFVDKLWILFERIKIILLLILITIYIIVLILSFISPSNNATKDVTETFVSTVVPRNITDGLKKSMNLIKRGFT